MPKAKYVFNKSTQEMLGALNDIVVGVWQVYTTSIMYGFNKQQSFTLARDYLALIINSAYKHQQE